MMEGDQVYGWPKNGYPAPQGPFYCGVGDEAAYGRPLAEEHLDACVECGLTISGINAEVCSTAVETLTSRTSVVAMLSCWLFRSSMASVVTMQVLPGQWEFQIGPAGPLEMGDEVRSCERMSCTTVVVSLTYTCIICGRQQATLCSLHAGPSVCTCSSEA